MELNNINDLSSSDIEELIHKPVSFSLNDDFFTERTPVKEDYLNMYSDIAPLVQTPKYTSDTSFKKGASRRREEQRPERNDKYSMLPEFTGRFKYEFVMSEDEQVVKEEIPQKEDVKEDVRTFFTEPEKNIFGEKRTDEDILFGYDINRLFDIQKEISVLINAIQRLQSSQLRISKREEELTQKAQSIIKENERKKAIIDKLVDDVTSLYEVLKLRTELVEEKEDVILSELQKPDITYTSPEEEKPVVAWAEKPVIEKKPSSVPMSFSEQNAAAKEEVKEEIAEEVYEENIHTPQQPYYPSFDVSCPGLNPSNIAAINRAINSLK